MDVAADGSSTGEVDGWLEASSDASDGDSSGADQTMPATSDRDPSSGSYTDTGWASSEAGDGTTDEGGSDDIGKFQLDLGGETGEDLGGCCTPSAEAGCADAMIESCVCELDAYCCEEAWDEVCVHTAEQSGCSPCGMERPPQLECCSANMVEGCIDPEVQDCVCAVDPYCCAQAWDQACVDMIDELGCGVCA